MGGSNATKETKEKGKKRQIQRDKNDKKNIQIISGHGKGGR